MKTTDKPYYTLIVRWTIDDLWTPQFGDFDREVVEQEIEDSYNADDCYMSNIIQTFDEDQACIDDAIAEINAIPIG